MNKEQIKGYIIIGFFAMLLLGWCWFLATSDISQACNGTVVSGWNNGGYTQLCIEDGK